MLRKQTIIKIKNSRLRAIRLNLRKILWNLYYDQEAALKAIWLGTERGDKKISLLRELEDFRESFHNSIIVCGVCNKVEGDRVYIPRHKCWYCTDCMKKNFIPTRKSMGRLISKLFLGDLILESLYIREEIIDLQKLRL